jgi:hypothetical protein
MAQRSAAGQIYPHLPSAAREPVQQRTPGLGDAMWPSLSREARAKEADQRLWDEICKRSRDNLLRGLKELRLARERGRR